ncbi:MAG: transcriptional regulator with XRE-family HTH domain [Psychroserpens sp.]|jgi:transcriptional regulator with XRE-family HTH domain
MKLKSALLQEIRKRREEKKISQADLAELLNISSDAYRKIENESNGLSVNRLFNICQNLDFSLAMFFTSNRGEQINAEVLEIENTQLRKDLEYVIADVWYLRETNSKLMGIIGVNSINLQGIKQSPN